MGNKISKASCLNAIQLIIFSLCFDISGNSQLLTGFTATNSFQEQEVWIKNGLDSMTININAPLHFNKKGETFLILFALPNGNSIEWTKGKKMQQGDDWHFDIQHIAAQTRFVRLLDKKNNYVVAYLMADQKSWPYWKRTTINSKNKIRNIVDSLSKILDGYRPIVFLNGHSGGGSFIFGYLDVVDEIPANIKRIAFLDSDYGYEDSLHTRKFVDWLHKDKRNNLFVVAYNDSTVIFNGKQLVSATGGTWYRSRLMQRKLAENFQFKTIEDTSFIYHDAMNGRVKITLKRNPNGLIYHTMQVERNGFIHSILSNTKFDKRKYFTYWEKRAYEKYISDD